MNSAVGDNRWSRFFGAGQSCYSLGLTRVVIRERATPLLNFLVIAYLPPSINLNNTSITLIIYLIISIPTNPSQPTQRRLIFQNVQKSFNQRSPRRWKSVIGFSSIRHQTCNLPNFSIDRSIWPTVISREGP